MYDFKLNYDSSKITITSSVPSQVGTGQELTITGHTNTGYGYSNNNFISDYDGLDYRAYYDNTITDNGNGTYSFTLTITIDASEEQLSGSYPYVTLLAPVLNKKITYSLTGASASSSNPNWLLVGKQGTFYFTALKHYSLSASPSVSDATINSWDSGVGKLIITA